MHDGGVAEEQNLYHNDPWVKTKKTKTLSRSHGESSFPDNSNCKLPLISPHLTYKPRVTWSMYMYIL